MRLLRTKLRNFGVWVKTYFSLEKKHVVIGFCVFTLLALAGSVLGFKGYRYMWVNPNFCYACHIHDYANKTWASGIHAQATTCHDCHQAGLGYYMRVSYSMLLDKPTFPDDLTHVPIIPADVCRSCHISDETKDLKMETTTIPMEDIARFAKIDQTRLHAIHLKQDDPLNPSRKINCQHCHGSKMNRTHQFTASAENCLQCHREVEHDTSIRSVHGIPCSKCHFIDFVTLGATKY